MLERLLGYRTYSYEDWLVKYHGTVIYQSTPSPSVTAYYSPGINIVRLGVGSYLLQLIDKAPIWASRLGQNAPTNWYGAVDQGFADTLQINASARNDQSIPGVITQINVSNPALIAPNRLQYQVDTFINGTHTDFSWTFTCNLTGQPQRFVFGLGA